MTVTLGTRRLFSPDASKQYIPINTRPRRYLDEAHEKVLAKCGTWYTITNYATGSFTRFQRFCGLKDCPRCGKRRGESFSHRILHVIEDTHDDVYSVTLPIDEATSLARKLGKDNYLRLPQRDGTDVVIFTNQQHVDVTNIKFTRYSGHDWTDRKSTRLNSSHIPLSRMPASA